MAASHHVHSLLTSLLVMACTTASGTTRAAEIAIAPTTAHIPADSDQATVWLYNQAAQPWRADAKLYHWRQDGERELLEPASGATVSPAHFEIPSQGRQLLRVIRLGPSPTQAEDSYRLVVTQHAIGNETDLLRYSTPVFAQSSQASAPQPALQTTLAGHGSDRMLRIHNPGVSHARLADLPTSTRMAPAAASARTWPAMSCPVRPASGPCPATCPQAAAASWRVSIAISRARWL